MVFGAAHAASHPEHADHCVLCLLYRSVEATVGVAAPVLAFCSLARTFPALRAGALCDASVPRALGRSPPAL